MSNILFCGVKCLDINLVGIIDDDAPNGDEYFVKYFLSSSFNVLRFVLDLFIISSSFNVLRFVLDPFLIFEPLSINI